MCQSNEKKNTYFVAKWKSKDVSNIQIFFPIPNIRTFYHYFLKYHIPFLIGKQTNKQSKGSSNAVHHHS